MTAQEAIKDIKENIKPVVGGKSLDLAIEALEKQISLERILERLQDDLELSGKEKSRTKKENPLQFDKVVGYSNGIATAIEIIKEEGGFCD